MSGTTAGALKAWQLRRERGDHLNTEFYQQLGRSSHLGSFGADPEFAQKMAKERWRRHRIHKAWERRKQHSF